MLALSVAVCSFVAPAGTASRGSVAAATAAAPVAPHVRMMNLFGRTGAPQPRHRLHLCGTAARSDLCAAPARVAP